MSVDALGRPLSLAAPPRRVVSLVPSETESVAALAGLERLVGRTEYCEEPAGQIERVPTVGGTKNVDVAAVIALRPDLVLANKEESSQRDVERLIDAGLPVFVSFPCTVEESLDYVETLARLLHVDAPPRPTLARRQGELRVYAPIWKDPWMTMDGRTYGSDLLSWLGADNVFSDRARRYPLAADVAGAPAADPGARDTRYPRVTAEEIRARGPALVLLPDEPYRFDETHLEEVRSWGVEAALVSGKDLFWYGVRTAGALERLDRALAPHR
ncbi:MAG: helical backbone metal receptor [Sandaracinaceae bacterium]